MAFVEYTVKDRLAHIVLNRPAKLNALTSDGIAELTKAMIKFDGDPDAFIAILSGQGRAFSTGSDVGERLLPASAAGIESHYLPSETDVFLHPVNWKPVIAALHGYVLGHAMHMALLCDLVVASEETQFQITETVHGVPAGGHWAMIARRGIDVFATEVALTGRMFSAREALEHGIVNQVTPAGEHVQAAEKLAAQVLKNPPLAVRATVAVRRRMLEDLFSQANTRALGFRWDTSEDFKESVQAFLEKRQPTFHGR